MLGIHKIWRSYTLLEKRNIAFYIGGIMCYKFGIEFFNGSIIALAADRFGAAHAYTKLGAATGLNQAAQCVGAILIAPLIKSWPTRTVLAFGIFTFALMTTLLLVVDAGTGGHFKDPISKDPQYGSWPVDLIFLFWTLSGICYGMVELIRRVIPADIVGGKVHKLRPMDATVHIFYEIAGMSGAFASSSAIDRFGSNYSFFLTPVFFTLAGVIWLFVSTLSFRQDSIIDGELDQNGLAKVGPKGRTSAGYVAQVGRGISSFGESVWVGGKLIFLNRRFIWLLPSYAVALYLHRFLENILATTFANLVLVNPAWSQIIVGGSNFGELLGALAVLLLSNLVTTPLPWLRFDALALNLVWLLPFFSTIATPGDITWAVKAAACVLPISMGWAAGDVSLAAYIQSALTESNFSHPRVSALGAVMAFLYATYIIMNATLGSALGKVIDNEFNRTKSPYTAYLTVGGAQFSVACVVILLSTFVPVGACAFNPKVIGIVDISTEEPIRPTGNRLHLPQRNDDLSDDESVGVGGIKLEDRLRTQTTHSH
ncbi:hypothetical protein FA15DRAFT_430422 [Coprinopsis marcescibilis]|uniref:MFS general substrate transporter n=1 Tax=Coprinopsis marcescibilis TaxID=230819 RepID=A0A5C3L8W3_COPMA|nr:hypothetical protein FA15DRAFT_430422 [Coprinopsis marcescibilis]